MGDGPKVNKYVKEAFAIMRFIVTVGWSIYPLGYFFGYLCGAVEDDVLNLVYNLADFVNKIAFCLAIWASAKNSTLDSREGALLGRHAWNVSGAQQRRPAAPCAHARRWRLWHLVPTLADGRRLCSRVRVHNPELGCW